MLHIENLTIYANQDTTALSRAFIDAILRTPEVNIGAEGEAPVPTSSTSQPPSIGDYWEGQGGIYGGLCRGRDGEADYHLILCKEATEQEFKWQAALDYAKTVEADGHKDFTVPSRWESALLYANLQDQFDTDYWHWTSTQYSEYYAWIQHFDDGLQGGSSKVSERRARFVRRLAL